MGTLLRVLPGGKPSRMVRPLCAYWRMCSAGLSVAAQAHQATGTLNANMRQTRLRHVFTRTLYRIAIRPDLPGPFELTKSRTTNPLIPTSLLPGVVGGSQPALLVAGEHDEGNAFRGDRA